MGSGCTRPVMGRSGPICLPTSSHLGQSGGEVAALPMQQDHSDCTMVAQHALVLGSSGNVQSDPLVSAQPAQSGVSTFQPDPAQEPFKPEPTCLARRATAIKEHGFSEAVAARVTGPCVQSEPFSITWTGPQILGRTRSWSLSPSRKVLIRTSRQPPSPHGSNKL